MITVDDFKKLMNLETGLYGKYKIFINDEEIDGLRYDEDPYQDVIGQDIRCTFVFANDKYLITHYLNDYKDSDWTVRQNIDIDWRNL
jgi:hypothetical protein